MLEPLYFDLETTHLFEDLGMREKHQRDSRKLPMAVAGTLYKGQITFYEKPQVWALVQQLESAERIVGHNVLEFDYPIVEHECGRKLAPEIIPRTIDMFARIRKRTGDWVSLDDLARHNLGKQKTYNGREIPAMWRAGRHEEVKTYLKNDLMLTEEIFNYGIANKVLKYPEKSYGHPTGRMKIIQVIRN